jgi:hypothetical protein
LFLVACAVRLHFALKMSLKYWRTAAQLHGVTPEDKAKYSSTLEEKRQDIKKKKTPWLLVRKRTIPTDRPSLVGKI